LVGWKIVSGIFKINAKNSIYCKLNYCFSAKRPKIPKVIVDDFNKFAKSIKNQQTNVIDNALKRVILCGYQEPATFPYESLEIDFDILSIKRNDVIEQRDLEIKEIDVSQKKLISRWYPLFI